MNAKQHDDDLKADLLVVGCGFFGMRLAIHARRLGLDVLMVDRESRPMARASRHNQARVHLGYHYPRSFVTAVRSARGSRRFIAEYPAAIKSDFEHVYAIARHGSLVTPGQFEKFMSEAGSALAPAPAAAKIFADGAISAAWTTREPAFNADIIGAQLEAEAHLIGVRMMLSTDVRLIGGRSAELRPVLEESAPQMIRFDKAVVATYAGIGSSDSPMKDLVDLQLTEMLLIDPGPELHGMAVTVMDGPFFSCMPWPPATRDGRTLHSLSHVRFTPHRLLEDHERSNPYAASASLDRSAASHILSASAAMMPLLAHTEVVRSVVEIKALPRSASVTDGRPIVWQVSSDAPDVAYVLGSKLDCIYDAEIELEKFLA